MLRPISTPEDRAQRLAFLELLRTTPAATLAAMGEASTLEAFQRTARSVPAYASMLEQDGVRPSDIRTIDAFLAKAPLLDKQNTFGAHPIARLCADGSLEGIRSVLTSSGFLSGVFSFGVNSSENLARSAMSIDTGLQYLFQVDERSTLLINALPMGVKINTRAAVLAETSVREDMVFAVIKKFRDEFEQFIIVGEGSFIKKIIEDGTERHGIDWPRLRVHLITGEEGIAENYRSYLAPLLGIDDIDAPHAQIIGSSMGVAELDLNIFHETRESIRIRRLAHRDPALRRALFGTNDRHCPMLFVYYPHRCYVEQHLGSGPMDELVISMLSEEMKIPLLRYRSGDQGRILPWEGMVSTLAEHGYPIEPELRLPFVAVAGRGLSLETESGPLYPEAVKEALYHDPEIARMVTGNFRLVAEGAGVRLHVQLRPERACSARTAEQLGEHVMLYAGVAPRVTMHEHARFPFNMGVDYERKFAYL